MRVETFRVIRYSYDLVIEKVRRLMTRSFGHSTSLRGLSTSIKLQPRYEENYLDLLTICKGFLCS